MRHFIRKIVSLNAFESHDVQEVNFKSSECIKLQLCLDKMLMKEIKNVKENDNYKKKKKPMENSHTHSPSRLC